MLYYNFFHCKLTFNHIYNTLLSDLVKHNQNSWNLCLTRHFVRIARHVYFLSYVSSSYHVYSGMPMDVLKKTCSSSSGVTFKMFLSDQSFSIPTLFHGNKVASDFVNINKSSRHNYQKSHTLLWKFPTRTCMRPLVKTVFRAASLFLLSNI